MEFAKYARYFLYGIMGISVIFTILFYLEVKLPEPRITDLFLKYSYVLLILAILATIGFTVYNLIGATKNVKNIAIVLIAIAVLLLISRLLASDKVLELQAYTGSDNVPSVLKNVGTGLIATYILLGVTILAIIYSEVSKMLK